MTSPPPPAAPHGDPGDGVRFHGVHFAWPGGPTTLDGLDLEVPPGGMTAFVGPSGCGKSTLLRLAAGLSSPDAGRVELPQGQRAFVFQSPTLLPWRSVRDNVGLPLELAGRSDPEGVQRALAQVGLGEAGDKLPRELSGGMKMRVSLARALVTRPTLMLMDEPFSALDALTRARLHQEFLALRRAEGFTTLLVTHDIDEAVLLCDTVQVFHGPPLRLRLTLEVDLPRPRESALRFDPRVGRMVEQIREALGEVTP